MKPVGAVSIHTLRRPLSDLHELRPEHGGLRLHSAARLSPASSHSIREVVTDPNTHETNCFEDLLEQVEIYEDLDEIIATFDRGYVDYNQFCSLKYRILSFLTPMKNNTSKPGQRHEMDFAEVHDCFTGAEAMASEAIDFFEDDEGGPAAEEGRTAIDGDRSINKLRIGRETLISLSTENER